MEKKDITKIFIASSIAAAGLFAVVVLYFDLCDEVFCRLLSAFLLGGISLAVFIMLICSMKAKKKQNDYVDSMVHELKTPIAGMQLICEMLSDKTISLTEEAKNGYIATLKEEIDRLKLLVGNILCSSQTAKIKHYALKDRVQANKLLAEVAGLFVPRIERLKGKISVEEDKLNSELMTDEMQLKNILINLVENAIKYSGDNIVINLSAKQEGDYFVFEVKDRGIGIAKKNLKKIFRKAYRVKAEGGTSQVKGFGIGLFYVYRTCKALKGEVKVRSEVGKGSVFSLNFPKELIITTKQ